MKLEGKDLEYFLKCCEEAGIKVTPAKPGEKGKVTMNGEPIDWDELWKMEVVRCRECLRAEPHYPGSEFFACELLGTVRLNDYCCYGQRREDGSE